MALTLIQSGIFLQSLFYDYKVYKIMCTILLNSIDITM